MNKVVNVNATIDTAFFFVGHITCVSASLPGWCSNLEENLIAMWSLLYNVCHWIYIVIGFNRLFLPSYSFSPPCIYFKCVKQDSFKGN